MRQDPQVLYRMYAADGRLLYIGITANPGARLDAHAHEKGWWVDVVTIQMQHFANRADVEAAEILAIRAENPVYNVRARTETKDSSRRKTPQRTIAVPDDEWDDFGRAASAVGSGRGKVLRQFAAWYISEPGVKPPQRPTR